MRRKKCSLRTAAKTLIKHVDESSAVTDSQLSNKFIVKKKDQTKKRFHLFSMMPTMLLQGRNCTIIAFSIKAIMRNKTLSVIFTVSIAV